MTGDARALPAAAFLVVGLALVGAEQLAAPGTEQALGHAAVNAFAGFGVLAGIRRHRLRPARAWWALAASLLLFSVGNLGWAASAAGTGGAIAPAVDIGARLISMIVFSFALLALLNDGYLRYDADALLDTVLVLTGALVLLGQLALLADASKPSGTTAFRLDSGGLLLLSVALLAVAVRMLVRGSSLSTVILVVAEALVLLGQGVVVLGAPVGAPRWVDATWLLGALLNGVAALHPSLGSLEAQAQARRARRLTPARSAVLAALLMANPVVIWLAIDGADRYRYLHSLQLVALGAVTLLGISAFGSTGSRDDPAAVGARRPTD